MIYKIWIIKKKWLHAIIREEEYEEEEEEYEEEEEEEEKIPDEYESVFIFIRIENNHF